LVQKLQGAKIHRAEDLALYALDPAALAELAGTVERANTWSLLRNDGVLYIEANGCPVSLPIEQLTI
jgi:uncharacterized protein YaeQ